MSQKSTDAQAVDVLDQENMPLEEQARLFGFKFLADRNDLNGRTLHKNKELVSLAKKNGLLLLDNGMILTDQPSNDESIVNLRNMASRLNIPTSVFVTQTYYIQTFYEADSLEGFNDDEEIEDLEDTKAVLRLTDIVAQGLQAKASDIHIELRGQSTFIRHREYGELKDIEQIPAGLGRSVISVAFRVKANGEFNFKEIQQGSFTQLIDGKEIRLRINYQPCVGGGDTVIRFLSNGNDNKVIPLNQLGYSPLHIYLFDAAVRRGSGAILISGPTGSGKTTTLAGVLSSIPRIRKIYTLEDPVEKIIPNATQVNVNSGASDQEGLAKQFKTYQKNLMRQDPDVLMLGEVRDYEIASTAMQMALTGHISLGTIHTNSGLAILTRLNDMGVSWPRLADPGLLRILSYQRLTTTLCPHCKLNINDISSDHPYVKNSVNRIAYKRISEHLDIDRHDSIFTRNPQGCSKCSEGKIGQTVLAEVIYVDNKGREYIREGDILGYHKYLESNGWESITRHALNLIYQGSIDPFEVDSIAGPIGGADDEQSFDYGKYSKLSLDGLEA